MAGAAPRSELAATARIPASHGEGSGGRRRWRGESDWSEGHGAADGGRRRRTAVCGEGEAARPITAYICTRRAQVRPGPFPISHSLYQTTSAGQSRATEKTPPPSDGAGEPSRPGSSSPRDATGSAGRHQFRAYPSPLAALARPPPSLSANLNAWPESSPSRPLNLRGRVQSPTISRPMVSLSLMPTLLLVMH
ncbi:uncharacterized protein LOC115673656 isoform X2 [Syzygium oleosum]|uniref:uncharacterized protein LOC115673656 isoform X2 n=1 Tax=Syzygium oleosum TaxID=219896 RepID=UPI0024BA098B|nr:uncharacterized protein LOC115673656 isoform X2 [Syzygium oleosum]